MEDMKNNLIEKRNKIINLLDSEKWKKTYNDWLQYFEE